MSSDELDVFLTKVTFQPRRRDSLSIDSFAPHFNNYWGCSEDVEGKNGTLCFFCKMSNDKLKKLSIQNEFTFGTFATSILPNSSIGYGQYTLSNGVELRCSTKNKEPSTQRDIIDYVLHDTRFNVKMRCSELESYIRKEPAMIKRDKPLKPVNAVQ